ncbi:helix-turn-helix transcriptional regulator [Hoeflea prorocentri]|uniref:AraC family transcriptional regulator n=1 Tax=Hoeflea prorocentri TaxID=1922333 RepID=A0A9X3UMD7_9HYPH|nr:AraC family transcriptional regulator [Hoeflea prorocentri]MCY6383259.1 AraC family transcriptional regulator [Hoeflea prorocentri]MDA5401059.1 AraC family transcriptional regulator [Hoeflea prorocentri]
MLRRNEDIYFYTPGRRAEAFPYQVVAAGRTRAAPDEAPIRRRFNQHVLILTLDGTGHLEVGNRVFSATAGSLTWLDTSGVYAHCCAPGLRDWLFLWMGVRGYGLDRIFDFTRARANPVVRPDNAAETATQFEAVIARLQQTATDMDAQNNLVVSQLVACFTQLRAGVGEEPPESAIDLAMRRIRSDLKRNWRISDMAELAELSPSQLHRRFRVATGTSPVDWLRRERITAAKRYLVETQDRIAPIAARCGYPDPYHFSRDFRRIAGQSPSAFRKTQGR